MGKQIRSKIAHFGLTDSISQENIKRWKLGRNRFADNFGQSDIDSPHFYRFSIFYLAIFLIVLVFLVRLFMLTIVQGEKNRALAEGNRVKLVDIQPKRGKIFDRNGVVLAESEKIYLLKKGLQVSEISQSQAKELEDQSLASEDIEGELGRIQIEVRRHYPLGEVAAHILGYTSIVQNQDIAGNSTLSADDSMGRLGLEETYDNFLRGKNGKKIVEVDAIGKKVSILGRGLPRDGRDIHTTIDSSLQKVAYEVLKKQAIKVGSGRGAVVITSPQSGEVLTLVSYPSFDPEDVGKSMTGLDKPLFNRAVLGTYPPGSIFKIVSALAGLESGKITRDTEIEDVGEFYLGNTRFANWFYLSYGGRDGVLKIDRAIARSNDIFFFRLAEKVGLDPIRQMAISLGFGQKTGIDLPGESLGLVPDEVWKKSAYNDSWYLGDTLHIGIGQGFILSTPLQINMLTSFMASGKLTQPYLVSKIDGEDKEVKMGSKTVRQNQVGTENFGIVRAGMKLACEKGGTGWPFFDAPYKVGCKTGTAEKALGDPHAWFTAFAPFDKPQISVTVIIEDGGEGSSVAGPVAREILDWWFGNQKLETRN